MRLVIGYWRIKGIALQIQKVTVTYYENEDRLALACEGDAGEVRCLWLTRRLADRLVLALVNHLEGQVAQRIDNPGARELVQSWELEAARKFQVPLPPVTSNGPVEHHLVHTINIAPAPDGVQLVFSAADTETARLSLETLALRQWLGILHQQYRQAAWPTEIWPGWFEAEALSVVERADVKMLH